VSIEQRPNAAPEASPDSTFSADIARKHELFRREGLSQRSNLNQRSSHTSEHSALFLTSYDNFAAMQKTGCRRLRIVLV
jgi:hypothetical protein